MTYKANKPQGPDVLSISQGDLLGNFMEIKTFWENNHGTINSDNQGFHKKVDFEGFVDDPNLAAPKSSLYPKNDGTGKANLFFQKNPGIIRLLTDLPFVTITFLAGTAPNPNGRYIDTPWGLRIASGTTDAFSGNATIRFNFSWTNIFVRQATSRNAGVAIGILDSGFPTDTITFNAKSIGVNWLLIGNV